MTILERRTYGTPIPPRSKTRLRLTLLLESSSTYSQPWRMYFKDEKTGFTYLWETKSEPRLEKGKSYTLTAWVDGSGNHFHLVDVRGLKEVGAPKAVPLTIEVYGEGSKGPWRTRDHYELYTDLETGEEYRLYSPVEKSFIKGRVRMDVRAIKEEGYTRISHIRNVAYL